MLTNFTVENISQYIHASNHDTEHLKLTQCYMSIISQETLQKKTVKRQPKELEKMFANHTTDEGVVYRLYKIL